MGHVAPSWDFRELHPDMKWDVGLGIHWMTRRFVSRIDFAVSKEGKRSGPWWGSPSEFSENAK
jgi:hypothetical protein